MKRKKKVPIHKRNLKVWQNTISVMGLDGNENPKVILELSEIEDESEH